MKSWMKHRLTAAGWALAILIVLMAAVNYELRWHPSGHARSIVWLLTLAGSISAVGVIGITVSGRISGLFIDNRNMMSLSKLQMVIWTLVVLPALITAAAANVAGLDATNAIGALNIKIPTELLAALGISGAIMAASPLVLSTKAAANPDPQEIVDTTRNLGLDSTQSGSVGKVFRKTDPGLASWSDLFLGDEVGNADVPDLGKIQQFFITLLLAGIYLEALGSMFAHGAYIDTLPELGEKFVWLLALSNGTYLAYKVAPHTNDAPSNSNLVAPVSASSGPALSPPGATSPGVFTATLRLAIEDAASVQALRLLVDGRDVAVTPSGLVELPLEVGRQHTINASGLRSGARVQGKLTVTPSRDDDQKPLSLRLGPGGP